MSEPSIEAAYSRTLNHSDKLFEALEDVAQAGGLRVLRTRMKPASVSRLAESLHSVRASIDEQLEALNRPDPKPARRALLRRQANKPDPISSTR